MHIDGHPAACRQTERGRKMSDFYVQIDSQGADLGAVPVAEYRGELCMGDAAYGVFDLFQTAGAGDAAYDEFSANFHAALPVIERADMGAVLAVTAGGRIFKLTKASFDADGIRTA